MNQAAFHILDFRPEQFADGWVFTELAQLIHYSLLELGYESEIGDRLSRIQPTQRPIFLGMHLCTADFLPKLPSNTIMFNTEQLISGGANHVRDKILAMARNFEVWDYHPENIDFFRQHGIYAKLFEIGYQQELQHIPLSSQPDIDVLFFGSINQRRADVLNALLKRDVKLEYLINVFGQRRNEMIARAKVVLNMHYYESKIFEIIRCSYLMNNGVAIVSECDDSHIHPRYLPAIVPARYDELVDKCVQLVRDDDLRRAQQQRALATLQQYPQTEFTRALLAPPKKRQFTLSVSIQR